MNNKMRDKNAMIQRINELADTKNVRIPSNAPRTIGTLIDYKRANDGIAYGIIKENHKYYIKRGGKGNNLNESDFVYINGLENITNYSYNSLADADKNRSMMLNTINESLKFTFSKKPLLENEIGDEIDNTEEKMDNLDAATQSDASAEIQAGNDSEPMGDETSMDDTPPMDGGNDEFPTEEPSTEEPVDGGAEPEMPAGDSADDINLDDINLDDNGDESPENAEPGAEELDDPLKDIEKGIGKLTNKIRKAEITPEQTKSFVNSYLAAFKDKFPDVEIEDRREMANRILKVVPDEDVESLSDTVTNDEVSENNKCGFVQYAESMGYDSAEALMENDDEVTNLISGYANQHEEGENDGDFDTIAMIIKVINPEIINKLKDEYGHDDYVEKLQPHMDQMNESSDEYSIENINELFGGLKAAGQNIMNKAKNAGQGIADKAKEVGQGVVNKAKEFGQGVADKAGQVKQGVSDFAKDVSQSYHSGEVAGEVKKLESMAASLGQQVQSLNTRLEKAGKTPINPSTIISTISNQLRGSGSVNIKNSKIGGSLEEVDDSINTEVPEQDAPEETPANLISTEDNLGVAGSRNTAPTTVTIEGANGTSIDIDLNEAVRQLKKIVSEAKKPSEGLTKKERSNIVKKAVSGKDIGEKGKDFEKVEKAAKKSGASDPKAVAAASMWKNAAKEKMNESEVKLRKYINNRLNELSGKTKPVLNENQKSEKLKKLDEMIDKQFYSYKSKFQSKIK